MGPGTDRRDAGNPGPSHGAGALTAPCSRLLQACTVPKTTGAAQRGLMAIVGPLRMRGTTDSEVHEESMKNAIAVLLSSGSRWNPELPKRVGIGPVRCRMRENVRIRISELHVCNSSGEYRAVGGRLIRHSVFAGNVRLIRMFFQDSTKEIR
jgi:hypothetical protein